MATSHLPLGVDCSKGTCPGRVPFFSFEDVSIPYAPTKKIAGSAGLVYSTFSHCGCSSMVEPEPSKLLTRVRFPSPAPCLPPLGGSFLSGSHFGCIRRRRRFQSRYSCISRIRRRRFQGRYSCSWPDSISQTSELGTLKASPLALQLVFLSYSTSLFSRDALR